MIVQAPRRRRKLKRPTPRRPARSDDRRRFYFLSPVSGLDTSKVIRLTLRMDGLTFMEISVTVAELPSFIPLAEKWLETGEFGEFPVAEFHREPWTPDYRWTLAAWIAAYGDASENGGKE